MKPLLVLAIVTAALPAFAQDPGLARCRAITDSAARLACYDALPLGAATARPGPAARETPAQFGLPRPEGAELPEIRSHIPGRFEGWGPNSRIRLANGQVWQVVDGTSRMWEKQDPAVTIRRGALGAFFLEIDGLQWSPRVRRIQ